MCCEINVRDGDSDDSDDCDNESESSSDKQSEEDESEAEYSLETKQNAEFLHLPPPSRKGKEIPSPIIEGVAHRVIPIIEDRRIRRFMDEDDDESSQHHGELSAHERDSDSFYDSDDVISLDDYDNNSHLFRPSMSDEMKSPIVSLNQADIANIFEHMPLDFINYKDGDEIHPYAINLDKRFQQEDDQDETEEYPLYLSHYDPLTPLSNMYCYPTSVQRILPPLPPLHGTSSSSSSSSSSRVIPVLVNEFSFNPKQVVCSFRDRIKFLLNDQEISHCTLYCEGEFDSILLDKNYQPYFIYQPSQCGSFIIKNEIYNFVCKVIVHDSNDLSRMNHQIESPPKLFGSFHPNMNNLPKPIFNMASLEQKEIDYSEKNAEYIDPSSAMMPNDYIHPSFTVTYPYEEEEFADVLQDLTYLNVDPDLTLVEDVKPIVFSSSADSTTAVSLATSEDSRDDDVDTDPEASFSGATNSLVLDSSANNTELEKLSRKAKKKKRRKEKQKLQKKMTREASNREDNMMNLDENLTAPENRKLEQDQESLEERIELSPEKDRSDGYMLATADFSEDFEVLSEDSQVDGDQGVKEGGSTSPDKLELNVTSSIMSPIIQRKTNIIISPVDKKAPIDDSIYDENVSFDSDEDNLAAEESKSEPQFTIPDSLVQLSEEESVKSLPALIPKPSTPPCSSKNSEDVSTPAATNTSHHVYTTPTSGKKTIALLSALGLKSKSIEERNPISSFDLLVETSESKGSPQKYHDPNHFQSPLSSVPDDISNISPSLINDEQQREQELQEFLLKRKHFSFPYTFHVI